MVLTVHSQKENYEIVIARGARKEAKDALASYSRVLIVTDDGVPSDYAAEIASFCKAPLCITVPQGEGSKSFATVEALCRAMQNADFGRGDAVVAVGGGVVGDLSGFVASIYMRGVDFYNLPTTLLSMVDSSVGGKTAVNLDGVKNSIGAFYPPKRVWIDPDYLTSLPQRQVANGLAEVIKMAVSLDASAFCALEQMDLLSCPMEMITEAVKQKIAIVEADEREGGLRRVLNFGHTVGHGIESCEGLHGLYHGECVALGMLPMCAPAVRDRLLPLLQRVGLPTELHFDFEKVTAALLHDKKRYGDRIHTVYVPTVGSYVFRTEAISDFAEQMKEFFV